MTDHNIVSSREPIGKNPYNEKKEMERWGKGRCGSFSEGTWGLAAKVLGVLG